MQPAEKIQPGNLPCELTSFVGRRREVTEARQALSTSRLVTLTGIGGVGKSRLALRVAAAESRAFADGVWLVELSELHDPSTLVDAVSSALTLREYRVGRPEVLLTEYLGSRQLLLVVDNCEHLVTDVAVLAELLLRTCPDLRILATSREPLLVEGEAVLRVPPLTVPKQESGLDGMRGYEAVALFADRAATAVPEFVLTEDNHAAVAQICQQLDGLPLAIELAAVRLRMMSTHQLLERLTDRCRLLTGGHRTAPTRQQALRWSIDWSYELCSPPERKLWGELAVFAGGFELDAVEGICAGTSDAAQLLDVVASLVDKSVLIREETEGTVRYRLLETLRDYGREKQQETGDCQSLTRRHRDWYAHLALRASEEWISPRQTQWITRLDREQSNLRAALHFCLTDRREAEAGLRMACALYPFWRSRGLFREGERWIDRLLDLHSGEPSAERINALYVLTVLAGIRGDHVRAAKSAQESATLARRYDSDAIRAVAAQAAGSAALFAGDLPRARLHLEEALILFRATGSLLPLIWTLLAIALTSGLQGDARRAESCHDETLQITESHGESLYQGWSLWVAGVVAWQQGRLGPADDLIARSLRLTRLVDDRIGVSGCLEVSSWICASRHDPLRAAELMGAAEVLAQAVGHPGSVYPNLLVHHAQCEQRARDAIGNQAFDAAFRQGMTRPWQETVASVLGEAHPPVASGFPDEPISLTRREGQVAELVADGLTDKAIADTLVMSQRTAQGHVERILAKLGFHSRTQIAAWVVERTPSRQR